ncbi:VOC family protein [Ferrimonas sp.]|uniref:VOC family protein n=1 Tax=Ferrimonas sp. TaxID=2080861 RepID=UPI003A91899C
MSETINYIEFGSNHLAASRSFFESAFGWRFTDYGADYTAFDGAGLQGGLYRGERGSRVDQGGALVVLYSDNLEASLEKVSALGAQICRPVFAFPGGRRFHFVEPGGNELAIWSDKEPLV